ncbi:peptidylprolyl isomerase [Tepidimonas aquatica]|uniref:Chaperone SurA n=1 Tax=Tepidimonas aquatica TaxID=247482 RepID=A0A554WLY3_9BURK|nr:peptidylprolyl isomerase [Tepidimonas aquatica]TSE24579.1 Chaperone SurA [Tepidimonas aquatica]
MNKPNRTLHAAATLLTIALALGGTGAAAQPLGARPGSTNASTSLDHIVALVGGQPITASEVRARLARIEVPADAPSSARASLAREVLERLIDERALLQVAQEQGVRVSDAEVDAAEAEVARRNGLSVEQLHQRLPSAGLTLASFRANLRDELTLQRLREREEARARVSEGDIDAWLREREHPTNPAQVALELAQVFIPVPENASAAQQAQAQQQADDVARRARAGEDFAALARQYSRAPEATQGGRLGLRTADRYPTLFWDAVRAQPAGSIVGPLRSGAGWHVLKVLTQRHVDLPEPTVTQTEVRHILLRADNDAQRQAAVEQLRALRQRIVAGQISFEDAARQTSQDASARDGGRLGWATPGLFVPEFEQAMDALAPGQVSEPVVSRFGVHLIEVLQRRDVPRSARELRDAVRALLRQRKADEALAELVREARARTYVEYREPPQ